MKAQKEITAFKKHLNVLCFLCTVIIPVLNNFILSLILSFISGDIMLVFWAELLEAFIVALDTVNLFLVFGVLINSVARFGYKNSGRVIAFCTVRIGMIYASYIAIGAIVTSSFANMLANNLLYCFTNAAIDVLLLVGAVFLISFLRSRFEETGDADESVGGILSFKKPMNTVILWVTALISAFLLSGCIINTVADVTTYGAADLNFTELIYLVSPYLRLIGKTVLGYVVMWASVRWFDLHWKTLNAKDGEI